MAQLITRADCADISQNIEGTVPLQQLSDATHVARQVVTKYGEKFRPILDRLEAELSARLGVDCRKGPIASTCKLTASRKVCAAVLGTTFCGAVIAMEDDATIKIDPADRSLSQFLKDAEAQYLTYVMTTAGGNKTKVSGMAGIARDTFQKKIQRYTIHAVFKFE